MTTTARFPRETINPIQPDKKICRLYRFPLAAQSAVRSCTGGKPAAKGNVLVTLLEKAQQQLGLTDAQYSQLLLVNFGVANNEALSTYELSVLIHYLRSHGWQYDFALKKPINGVYKLKNTKSKGEPAADALRCIQGLLCALSKSTGQAFMWDYALKILTAQTGFASFDVASLCELYKVIRCLEEELRKAEGKLA